MQTVFTLPSMIRMIDKGTFKTCRLGEWKNVDADEFFIYIFPSADLFNFDNGDGDFIEIEDWAVDLSSISLANGRTIPADKDTVIYYR